MFFLSIIINHHAKFKFDVIGGWVNKIWVTWSNYMFTFFKQEQQSEKYLVQPPSAKDLVLLTVFRIWQRYSWISTMLANDLKSSTFHRHTTGFFYSMWADWFKWQSRKGWKSLKSFKYIYQVPLTLCWVSGQSSQLVDFLHTKPN